MSESSLTITFRQVEGGRIEIKCECKKGESDFLNKAVVHVANELPMKVHNVMIDYMKNDKKGKKNGRIN